MKIIVGVDPGVKTALAIMGLNSSEVTFISRKDFSKGDIAEAIVNCGAPIIIAADTKRPSRLVKKISATFNVRLHAPKRNITALEKERISRKLGLGYKNRHERDAAVAAVLARNYYNNLFNKIDRYLERRNLSHISEDVKALVVNRRASNLIQAVRMVNGS